MKKVTFFCFCLLIVVNAYSSKLDINIIYEASRMKIKETVCGWQPDLDKGYILADDDCYQTKYELDVPMYGFTVEPKSTPVPEDVRVAYYLSFFDSAIPKDDLVYTEVIKKDKVLRSVKGVKHNRTFQGLTLLKRGESIRFSSKAEPSYIYIYIIAVLSVSAGLFFIFRKKR